jgi:hypothetical protein
VLRLPLQDDKRPGFGLNEAARNQNPATLQGASVADACRLGALVHCHVSGKLYLGFLLILLGWAAFLSNILALVLLHVFILYVNREE